MTASGDGANPFNCDMLREIDQDEAPAIMRGAGLADSLWLPVV